KGEQVYALPKLSDAYVIPNHNGTRFVTYERIASFLCLVCETEKLRVQVFRSADGKKLFEYQWRLSDAPDSISSGRVALSDDGALVALIRGEEVLVFAIVTGK
ncbi:MAG TPA: hypothetical protein VEW69_06245, partial [Alphaproteobacteria bacterium]|nr:hypothetical protein [Alphaproteobacteria bacterium]